MIVPGQQHLTEITAVIQLAVAPVFLLTAVGTLINVLSTRLARVIDRSRDLEERIAHGAELADERLWLDELRMLERRMRLTYLSFGLAVV